MKQDKATLRRALALHRQGAYTEALGLYADLSTRHGDATPIGNDCAFYGGIAAYELRSLMPEELSAETAIALLERAVRCRPKSADLWVSLGHMQLEAGHPSQARDCYVRALKLDPARLKAQAEAAYACLDLGLPSQAMWRLELAMGMTPTTPRDHYHRGLACLLAGQWADGWREYEFRWQLEAWAPERRVPELAGVPQGVGGRQLLHGEQGMGDTLMTLRWVPILRARVDHLTLQVQRGLGTLLRGQWPDVDVIEQGDPVPPVDHWCASMSLPALFRATWDTVPPAPYLVAGRWFRGLVPNGQRVGIVWAGAAAHKNDARRSTRLEDWAPVLDVAGLELFSLQVGAPAAELGRFGAGVRDLGPQLTDWRLTAGALTELDLVITVDTGISHLAGALGVPCWTLLAAAPDWRWGLGSDRTPWYGAHRLFRQRRGGDWGPVFADVAAGLRTLVDAGRLDAVG